MSELEVFHNGCSRCRHRVVAILEQRKNKIGVNQSSRFYEQAEGRKVNLTGGGGKRELKRTSCTSGNADLLFHRLLFVWLVFPETANFLIGLLEWSEHRQFDHGAAGF